MYEEYESFCLMVTIEYYIKEDDRWEEHWTRVEHYRDTGEGNFSK